METEVRAQIAHLNGVLNYLNDLLAMDIDAALQNATTNLKNTQFKIEAAEDLLIKTKVDVVKTQLFLQGKSKSLSRSLSQSFTTLKSVEYFIYTYICSVKLFVISIGGKLLPTV